MKTKCFKVEEGLYLNEQTVDVPLVPAVAKIESKHQYLIIDRSGSMWCELDSIVDSLVDYVKSLPEGYSVSVGYFSGYGQYSLTVPYTLKKEQDAVVKVLDTYRDSMGLTNFIEVLEKVEAYGNGNKGSLFFFTDGCHNCGSFKEVTDILTRLKDYLDVSVFVGCGYIDRENMKDMALASNGSFIQLSDFSEFRQVLEEFGESVKEVSDTIEVAIPDSATDICSLLGRNVVCYAPVDGKINYKLSTRGKQAVYFTSSEPFGEVTEIGVKDELPVRALAYSLVRSNKTPVALKALNAIGDKYYMRKLFNTFTADEYASIENELVKSIFDTRKRYKEGKTENYLPDPDAFCVLDALGILVQDDEARVHLNDPDFKYSVISRKMEQTDGSKLVYPADISASANSIKFHESRLNASLSVSYQASVPMNASEFANVSVDDLSKHGIMDGELYPVSCFRTYNIILDGKLKTKQLVLSKISKVSKHALSDLLTLRDDGKYILDLSGIPLINRNYTQSASAKSLALNCWKQHLLSTGSSVLRYLIKRKKEDSDFVEQPDDKLMFLSENCYISRGTYQPPKTQAPVTDVYSAYEFIVSFKGYTKASASSVIKKIESGKSVTQREKLVEYFYNDYKDLSLGELEECLKNLTEELSILTAEIQASKLAAILVNRGSFEDISDRSNMTVEIDPAADVLLGLDLGSSVVAEFTITQKEVEI